MFTKRIIAFFFLGLFVTQTFGNVFVIGSFLLNKEYIAKYLCENKAKPQLKCNGKCHLKKMLQKQEEKQQPFSYPVIKETKEVNEVTNINCSFAINRVLESIIQSAIFLSINEPHHGSVFHPPSV